MFKRIFIIGLLIALVLFQVASMVQAAEITVCRETVDDAFLEAYVGWQFNGDELILTFKGIDWNAESTHWTGEAISDVGTGDLSVLADSSALFAYWDGEQYVVTEGNAESPLCDDVFEGDAPSIAIQIDTDCAFVEIRDVNGNWHRVKSNGESVLLHYGEALIAGRSQSLDSEDYRAIETACY